MGRVSEIERSIIGLEEVPDCQYQSRKKVSPVLLHTDMANCGGRILKKHDKRTALTASIGFQDFVRSTLAAQIDKDGSISSWVFYNTSLPHVLLASLTNTLLPYVAPDTITALLTVSLHQNSSKPR